jgi:hypothetical protein
MRTPDEENCYWVCLHLYVLRHILHIHVIYTRHSIASTSSCTELRYPAILVILLVTGNIEGDGDDKKDTTNRSYSKQPFFKIEVEPLNPLNAELNPMCHLLILFGDLTFMGNCIVSVSNKMQS